MPSERVSSFRKTPVGVVATLGEWHRVAPAYGLRHLEALVREFAPDLLCAEITRAEWEARRLESFPPEYRECLVPLCRKLGIIIVPVGSPWQGPLSPLRLALLVGGGPSWANSGAADGWNRLWARLGPDFRQANRRLVANILGTVQRDPGRRLLATVRLERRHAVVDGLRRAKGVALVPVLAAPD